VGKLLVTVFDWDFFFSLFVIFVFVCTTIITKVSFKSRENRDLMNKREKKDNKPKQNVHSLFFYTLIHILLTYTHGQKVEKKKTKEKEKFREGEINKIELRLLCMYNFFLQACFFRFVCLFFFFVFVCLSVCVMCNFYLLMGEKLYLLLRIEGVKIM